MRSVHWIAATVLVLPALAACSERQEVRKPLQQGADMIITYIVAKRELADRLGEALGANRSSKYRLMALVGPSYPIGAAVDPENTIDIITEKCVLPKSALAKEPTPWADFPTAKASRKIDLNASAPIPLRNALKNAVDAGAKFDFRTASEFGLVELSQILVPQDQFEKAMAAPRCAQALPDRSALLVRGVVYGKEVFASSHQLGASANVKLWKNDTFTASYDDSGAYELRDASRRPKFYVVTLLPPRTRGEAPEFQRPPDEVADKADATAGR